jgi:hypothetical protein
MKRIILSAILLTALTTVASRPSLAAPLNCKEIFNRCVEDCRRVFDIGVLKDACAVGCFIGYLNCE